MIKNDRVYGVPLTQYKDTKANIEALSGIPEGAIAYATDSNEFGSYDGTTWTWGQSGSSAPATTAANDFQVGNGSGSWVKKTLAETITILRTSLDSVYAALLASTASNDFQVGNGSGGWVKKTLAETITILRTSLDSVYAALSHTHAASDITSGTLGAARLPVPTTTTLGGVARNTGSAGEYVTGIDASGNLEYDTPAGGGSSDGWTAYSAVVPTRSAADDPTYTLQFAGVDLRTTLYEGMPIKWTQNSIVRYGWISSAPAFSTNTTITVLTRLDSSSADYDVLDTGTYTISNFAYGLPKQPGVGFVIAESAWTKETRGTGTGSQASPTTGTWYNLGSNSIAIPIGSFKVSYECHSIFASSSGSQFLNYMVTLSTANNTQSDSDFTARYGTTGATAQMSIKGTLYREKTLVLTTKATYYLNMQKESGDGSGLTIYIDGSQSPVFLRARCTYL